MAGASSVGASKVDESKSAPASGKVEEGGETKKELIRVQSHFTANPKVVEDISEHYFLDENQQLGKGSFGQVLCGHPIDQPDCQYVGVRMNACTYECKHVRA